MRILLIKDESHLRENIVSWIASRGHSIATASNLIELKQAGALRHFGLLVVDIAATQIDCLTLIETQSRLRQGFRSLVLSVGEEQRQALAELGYETQQLLPEAFDEATFIAALKSFERSDQSNSPPAYSRSEPNPETRLDMLINKTRNRDQATAPAEPGTKRGRMITIASHKGGTGKTTIAMHFVAGLLQRGLRVAAVDLDRPQLTLTRYLDNRRSYAEEHSLNLPLPFHSAPNGNGQNLSALQRNLRDLAQRMDAVIVDCPAGDHPQSGIALRTADIVITPINDSFVDLDLLAIVEPKTWRLKRPGALGAAVEEARRYKSQHDGGSIDWIVMRNRLSSLDAHNKTSMADALGGLASRLGFRQVSGLGERVIYRELFLEGLTLLDLRRKGVEKKLSLSHVAARQELRELIDSVLPELHHTLNEQKSSAG
ncbi:MAG: division plane positioning ATPase MipZ [Kiloniellales bacterium]|nr:division plane positioning ATPase MipZ [Kiloniellales bacterium]